MCYDTESCRLCIRPVPLSSPDSILAFPIISIPRNTEGIENYSRASNTNKAYHNMN